MSSTQLLSRKIRRAWATASQTLPALTSTVCLTSLRSKQETLHVFKATTTIYHFRFSFARVAEKICRSGIRTKEKRTIEEGGVSLMPASSTVRLQGRSLPSNYLGSTRLPRHIFKPGSRRSEVGKGGVPSNP